MTFRIEQKLLIDTNRIIAFKHYLADKKVHTSVHFKPLYKYGPLKQDREYPVSETEWLKLLTLPCHNRMTEEDIDYVIYWVNKYFEDTL